MPALTPAAVVNLSWRYAWSMINVRHEEIETETGNATATREPVRLLPRQGGGFHAPGFSKLFGMMG